MGLMSFIRDRAGHPSRQVASSARSFSDPDSPFHAANVRRANAARDSRLGPSPFSEAGKQSAAKNDVERGRAVTAQANADSTGHSGEVDLSGRLAGTSAGSAGPNTGGGTLKGRVSLDSMISDYKKKPGTHLFTVKHSGGKSDSGDVGPGTITGTLHGSAGKYSVIDHKTNQRINLTPGSQVSAKHSQTISDNPFEK